MIENGALAEVLALDKMCLDPVLPAMKALGVQELRAAINGDKTLNRATDDAKRATRQFAKRQMTWFRNQLKTDLTLFAIFERIEGNLFIC